MPIDLSIVIPVYNEAPNLAPLVEEIRTTLDARSLAYEVIFVDDGSHDDSFERLKRLQTSHPELVVIRFRRNFGQTAAFAAGFQQARGEVVITMDADRQNDPADIPALLDKLAEGYDVVNGWRNNRQDAWLSRKLPSLMANRLIATSTGVRLRDRGCSLRAFRREVVLALNLYGEMHRFIPELVSNAGFSMAEVPVNHRPRVAGVSKYGLGRTFRVILDLITVLFIRRYGDRPMHLFGSLGLVFGGVGGLAVFWLVAAKIIAGITGGMDGFRAYEIGDRPILSLGVLLVILGTQFLVIGLLAELQVRTYYESRGRPVYQIQELLKAET
jgi:glycosyltransferase involved in cell wall biosynthesis